MECSEVIELIKVSTPTIITFLCTMIGGGFIWCLRHYLEVIRTKEKRLYQERRELYIDILEPYIRSFTSIHTPKELNKAVQQIKSYDYRKKSCEFNMVASDKVMSSFNNFVQYIYNNKVYSDEQNTREFAKYWTKLILECRRDLGSKETKMKEKDMLKNWVSDIDNLNL